MELLGAVKTGGAGLGVVFAILWWLERRERIEAQDKNGVMVEKMITALESTKQTMQTFGSILSGGPRPGS